MSESNETEVQIINDNSKYKLAKEKNEKIWFKLLDPACYIKEEEDGNITYKSLKDVIHNFEHERVTIIANSKKKVSSFFDLWRIDPNIRLYQKIVFKPTPLIVNKGEYNTFKGFPVKKGKIVPIDEFKEILNSLCNYESESICYLTAHLADMIQNPAIQNKSHGIAIIFRGEQGAGKGTLFTIVQKILGYKYVNNTSDINSIIKSKDNRFANGAIDKLAVFIEELCQNDGYSKADQLKDYITNNEIEEEIKNLQGTIKHKNFARFYIFTNHAVSIKIESSDRRYVMFRTSDKYIGQIDFWNNVYKKIENDDYIYSIYQYLIGIDINNFDFKDRPITDAYKRSKVNSIPPIIRYLSEISIRDKKAIRYEPAYLFEHFDYFLKSNKFKHEMTFPTFKAELNELVNEKSGIHKIKNSVIKYYIEIKELHEYCKKKKYDLFDDCEKNKDEEIKTITYEIEDVTNCKWYKNTLQLFENKRISKLSEKELDDEFKLIIN